MNNNSHSIEEVLPEHIVIPKEFFDSIKTKFADNSDAMEVFKHLEKEATIKKLIQT